MNQRSVSRDLLWNSVTQPFWLGTPTLPAGALLFLGLLIFLLTVVVRTAYDHCGSTLR